MAMTMTVVFLSCICRSFINAPQTNFAEDNAIMGDANLAFMFVFNYLLIDYIILLLGAERQEPVWQASVQNAVAN